MSTTLFAPENPAHVMHAIRQLQIGEQLVGGTGAPPATNIGIPGILPGAKILNAWWHDFLGWANPLAPALFTITGAGFVQHPQDTNLLPVVVHFINPIGTEELR